MKRKKNLYIQWLLSSRNYICFASFDPNFQTRQDFLDASDFCDFEIHVKGDFRREANEGSWQSTLFRVNLGVLLSRRLNEV